MGVKKISKAIKLGVAPLECALEEKEVQNLLRHANLKQDTSFAPKEKKALENFLRH